MKTILLAVGAFLLGGLVAFFVFEATREPSADEEFNALINELAE